MQRAVSRAPDFSNLAVYEIWTQHRVYTLDADRYRVSVRDIDTGTRQACTVVSVPVSPGADVGPASRFSSAFRCLTLGHVHSSTPMLTKRGVGS